MICFLILKCTLFIYFYKEETFEIWLAEIKDKEKVLPVGGVTTWKHSWGLAGWYWVGAEGFKRAI